MRRYATASVFLVWIFGVSFLISQDSPPRTPLYGLIFDRLDADGNGKVTKEELISQGRKTEWIAQADADGDGALSLVEVQAFFRKRDEGEKKTEILVHDFPASSPVTEASCRAAADYSAGKNGYTCLVMVDGKVVFERYDQDWTPEKANRLASGTKSFSGALLAVAVKDGLLTLDEPVAKTIIEWQGNAELEGITIRQLLSLTSGMDPGDNGNVPPYADAVVWKNDEVMAAKPGEKFSYGPRPFQIFGEIIRRKLEAHEGLEFEDPLAYLEDRLLNPIGLEYPQWRRDANGMPHLPSGVFLTAREWVKFGELLINEGTHEGTALLDAETLKGALKGSDANPGYGLTFWLLDANPDRLKGRDWLKGGYMAAGAGKQRLFVLPAAGVVVVRQGESKVFEDIEMLDRLFSVEVGE